MKWSLIAAGIAAAALSSVATRPASPTAEPRWIASWACSQQAPEPQNNQPGIAAARLTDVTLRQVAHLSVGGESIRIHLSNEFGTRPLTIDSVRIARSLAADSSAIDLSTDHAVTFDGRASITIPAGAKFVSDPVALSVSPLSDVAISFHLETPPEIQTLHPGSRATSYLLHGQHATDRELTGAEKIEHWYQIAAIDVTLTSAATNAGAIVAFGDSITDGHGSTTDHNDRWPDVLARRLQASPATRGLSVLNEGIGGNHLLTDGLGVSALARMDRDVLAQSGVQYVFVLEGINDLGMLARGKQATPQEHAALVANMIAAYKQIVLRAHAHRLKVIGATLTPFVGSDYYFPTPANEADRQQVNAWIRSRGNFDAIVDFDAVVRDPANPERMLPSADSGDHLHPGPGGYKMMGESIPLDLFR